MEDSHSPDARELAEQNPRVWFTALIFAEFCHAVAKQVFYGKISRTAADAVLEDLKRDRADHVWFEAAMPENAFELCADLARRHGPDLGMRTLDTLHVACALELKAERFWTFDERQAKLAKEAGLRAS